MNLSRIVMYWCSQMVNTTISKLAVSTLTAVMTSLPSHVYYVSYGSNMCEERFMCYINGGTAPGGSTLHPGCRNKAPPRESALHVIKDYQLCFGGISRTWNGGGVGFIVPAEGSNSESNDDDRPFVLARRWLIELEQFFDVLMQEQHHGRDELSVLDAMHDEFATVLHKGQHVIGDGDYSLCLLIGELDGIPLVTFTRPSAIALAQLNSPSPAYIKVIARGLVETGHAKHDQQARELLSEAIAAMKQLSAKDELDEKANGERDIDVSA